MQRARLPWVSMRWAVISYVSMVGRLSFLFLQPFGKSRLQFFHRQQAIGQHRIVQQHQRPATGTPLRGFDIAVLNLKLYIQTQRAGGATQTLLQAQQVIACADDLQQ